MSGIAFNPERHEYSIDGVRVPSVTQVLKGCYDFSRVNEETLYRKAQLGQAVHLACELDDQDDLNEDTLEAAVRPYLDAYRSFKHQKKPRVIHNELIVHNEVRGYAGKLDLLCDFDEHRWVIDWKTPVSVSPAVALQTMAYAAALPPTLRGYAGLQDAAMRPLRRAALQLCDDGRYRLHEYPDPFDWPVFLAKLTSFLWDKEHLK